MSFSDIVILIMGIFSLMGAVDRIFGNRMGLGKDYENGITTIGPLAISMIGIMVLSPVIKDVSEPFIIPFFEFMGLDASVFAGSILACDMGGAPLSFELADTLDLARLSGILISSTLGVTVSFTIPVALMVIADQDKSYAAKGILCGVITIPFGILVGAFVANIPLSVTIINLLPVILISAVIAIGLIWFEKILIKTFVCFGKIIVAVATIGLAASGFEKITGITLIKGLGSIDEAFITVAGIAIVLSGAFPLISVIKTVLKRPLSACGKRGGVDEESVMGLIATLANSIATFGIIKKMNNRGKVINMAFAVSGSFALGDHLAFTADFDPYMIPALISCKLVSGVLATLLAFAVTKENKNV